MKAKVLNYAVIVKKDKETGTNKTGYSAFCPTLGVADDGNTVDEALKNVQEAMEVYIESLALDKQPVPQEDYIFTNKSVNITTPFEFAY